MIIAAFIFIVASIVMASIHSSMIKDGKKIRHGAWAAVYIGLACVFSYLSGQRNDVGFDWWMLLNSLLIRAVFFNLLLNKFRGVGIWYVTPELKNVKGWFDAIRKGRFIDYFHYRIFWRKVWLYSALYLIGAILITIYK